MSSLLVAYAGRLKARRRTADENVVGGWWRSDAGDVVVGWLTRVVVLLGLFGLVAFDGIAEGVAAMGAADDASTAASAGADTWRDTHDVDQAYQSAVSALTNDKDTIPPALFRVDGSGVVTLTVRRQVHTLVLRHIGPLRHLTVISESGTGRPSS